MIKLDFVKVEIGASDVQKYPHIQETGAPSIIIEENWSPHLQKLNRFTMKICVAYMQNGVKLNLFQMKGEGTACVYMRGRALVRPVIFLQLLSLCVSQAHKVNLKSTT